MTRKAIVAGTFDAVHDGHRALIQTASMHADEVVVGITNDEMANESRDRSVRPYIERIDNIMDVCQTFRNLWECEFNFRVIRDPHTLAVHSDADILVIAPEPKVRENAIKINNKRLQRGDDPLCIKEAPEITDYKGRKISATNVRNHEIDEHGDPA